jgi:hypothetical protein
MAFDRVKLGQCPRCSEYVLSGRLTGADIAVNPGPLTTLDAVRGALTGGATLYRLHTTRDGKPFRVSALDASTFAGVAQSVTSGTAVLVAGHPCPIRSARPSAVNAPDALAGPHRAPVSSGSGSGALRPRTAPESGSQGHTAPPGSQWGSSKTRPGSATPATPRPSDRRDFLYRRCQKCDNLMGFEQPYGIHYGEYWEAVWHDPCPNPKRNSYANTPPTAEGTGN